MYTKILQFLLKSFQISGLYPISIPKRNKSLDGMLFEGGQSTEILQRKLNRNEKALAMWSLIHLLFALSIAFGIFYNQDVILYDKNVIGKMNDLLLLSSLYCGHALIIIESFYRKSFFVAIWLDYSKIQKLNRKLHNDNKWLKEYFVMFIIYWIFTFSTEIFVRVDIEGKDSQWERFWYAGIISLLMTRMRHMQQLFYVELVLHLLRNINMHLKNCTEWSKALQPEMHMSYNFVYKSMKCKKDQFKLLVEMIICINRIFCWSQLVNFGQNFLEITSELYWVYAFMTREPEFLIGENCNSILNFEIIKLLFAL